MKTFVSLGIIALFTTACQTRLSSSSADGRFNAVDSSRAPLLEGGYRAPGSPSFFGYSQTSFSWTAGQAITPQRPNVAEPAATYFEVSPALPAGVTLNRASGEISGTPLPASSSGTINQSYTFYAGNSAGYISQAIQISVTTNATPTPPPSSALPPPSGGNGAPSFFAYPQTSYSFQAGSVVSGIRPNVATPAATYFEAHPPLPQGLALNRSSGEISGRPVGGTALQVSVHRMIAGNATGYVSQDLEVRVLPSVSATPTPAPTVAPTPAPTVAPTAAPPAQPTTPPSAGGNGVPTYFAYSATSFSFTSGVAVSGIRPNVNEPGANQFSADPALPAGLTVNAASGEISGNPAAVSVQRTTLHRMIARNSAGYITQDLQITIRPGASMPTPAPTAAPTVAPPAQPKTPTSSGGNGVPTYFSYPNTSYSFSIGQVVSGIRPNVNEPGANQFAVDPAFPAGLIVDSQSGEIRGTIASVAVLRTTLHRMIARNSAGYITQDLQITIQSGSGSPTPAPTSSPVPTPLPTAQPSSGFSTAEPSSYSAPIIIRQGGTYSGNWRTTQMGDTSFAVKIETEEPVTLVNSHFAGPGILINARYSRANLTVRNCAFHGYAPTQDNRARGRAIDLTWFRNAVIENNFFENTGTVVSSHEYQGDSSAQQTLKVRYNRVRNINGAYRNNMVWEHSNFQQFVAVQGYGGRNLRGAEIAWNEVINEPGKSATEDLINFHNSGGQPDSWFKVHNNFLKGSYQPNPWVQGASAGGVQIDGEYHNRTSYIEVFENTVMQIHNGGMGAAAGSNIYMHHNRVISSGLSPDGREYPANWGGLWIFSFYPQGPSVGYMTNIRLDSNVVGWHKTGQGMPYANRNDITVDILGGITNTIHLPNAPINLDTEAQEYQRWLQKVNAAGIRIGPQ